MAKTYRAGFIGAGNMARAIIGGMVEKGLYSANEIIVSNRSQKKLEALHKDLGVIMAKNNEEAANEAELLFIAVKPQQFASVAPEIAPVLDKGCVVVSIMAGMSMQQVQAALGGEAAIIRAMPNTPAQIGYGMTALCAQSDVPAEALTSVQRIFESVGQSLVVEEHLMDAAGAVSGCGPAYVYQMIEALSDGGVMVGLPRRCV